MAAAQIEWLMVRTGDGHFSSDRKRFFLGFALWIGGKTKGDPFFAELGPETIFVGPIVNELFYFRLPCGRRQSSFPKG